MAIQTSISPATPHPYHLIDGSTGVKVNEHLIQGEMITVQKVYSDLDYFELESKYQMDLPNIIKEELMDELVKELLKHTCISFTSQEDNLTLKKCFRARIFATPNDQVRIVKELLDKNNMA
jgi:hypothetical protein